MLDPLEIGRDKQLRRRRRECARCQKNRRANRAVIVIVGRNLHRRLLGRVRKPDLFGYGGMRIARQAAQVHVTKGQRNLQRQRNQRQCRAISFMATNRTHPDFPTNATPGAPAC